MTYTDSRTEFVVLNPEGEPVHFDARWTPSEKSFDGTPVFGSLEEAQSALTDLQHRITGDGVPESVGALYAVANRTVKISITATQKVSGQ